MAETSDDTVAQESPVASATTVAPLGEGAEPRTSTESGYTVIQRSPETEHLFAGDDKSDGLVIVAGTPVAEQDPTAESSTYWTWDGPETIIDLGYRWVTFYEYTAIPSDAVVTKAKIRHKVTHTYIGDLRATLQNESATKVWTIRDNEGGSADDFDETKTEYTLFDGQTARQDFTYYIYDEMGGDEGTLDLCYLWLYWETPQPDLTAPSASWKATTVEEGQPFWIETEVKNEGVGSAAYSYTRAWLSTDDDFDTSDDYDLGTAYTSSLNSGSNTAVRWDFNMPDLGSGEYPVWMLFEVDDTNRVSESNENNNLWKTNSSFTASDPSATIDLDLRDAGELWLADAPQGNRVDNPVVGQELYPHFDYTCVGTGTTPEYRIEITLDGHGLWAWGNNTAQAGYTYTTWANSPWTVTSGDSTWRAVVDVNDTVAESNEGNNYTWRSYNVSVVNTPPTIAGLPNTELNEDEDHPASVADRLSQGDQAVTPDALDGELLTPLGFNGALVPLGDSPQSGTRYRIFDEWGGAWADAEKDTQAGDNLLCWAGAASNVLEWTGWGSVDGMSTTDEMFQYFQDHFTDLGSLAYIGWDWWFDGGNIAQGWPDWAQEDVQGGDFYPTLDPDDYIHTRGQGSVAEQNAMKDIDQYCRAGYGVALGLFGSLGHAVTCWGFNYDNTLSPDDRDYYLGVWITDSDDNKTTSNGDTAPNVLHYYSVAWDSAEQRYDFDSYYPGAYIGQVDGLERPTQQATDLWFYADDEQTSSADLTYTITGNTDSDCGVSIVSNRYVEIHPDANWYGVSDVTIRVTDPEGRYDEDTFRITVNAVNDAPSFTKGSDQSVAEDAGPQTVNNWATAIDPGAANEAGQVLTFNASNDNPSLFSVQPAVDAGTGNLAYTPAPDASGSALVTLTLSDNGGMANGGVDTSPIQTFTITVNAVNDPPTVALQSVTTTLPENTDTTNRIKVADIVVTDDALGTNVLNLSGADVVLFEIDGTDLLLKAGVTLDFDTNPQLDVVVEVDDGTVGGTPDDTATLAISVTDVNEFADLIGRVSDTGDWYVAKSDGTAFTSAYWGKWSPNVDWQNVHVGDFTGDGKDDLVGRAPTGDWYVARSNGTAFTMEHWGKWSPNVNWIDVQVGDFDGNGKDDLVGRVSTTGDWYVAKSSGTAFTSSHWGKWSPNVSWDNVQVGDFSGDGKDDLVGRAPSGDWYVAASAGTAFTNAHWGKWSPNVSWDQIHVGDFSGDGKDDLVGRVRATGDWYVATSGGGSFSTTRWGKWSPNVNWDNIQVGDFSGDGKDDLVARVSTTGDWYVALSGGTAFSTTHWGKWSPNVDWDNIQVGDFSGDGKDDLVGRVGTTGDWYVAKSSGTSFTNSRWGIWSPRVTWEYVQVGNFDGAGSSAKFAPSSDSFGMVAAADQFWSELGQDEDEELVLQPETIDLLLMDY